MHSARTIQTAVNGKLDRNQDWAEARCRVVSGLTLLAPGIPMFFMGEEVGAREPYRHNDWLYHREDFQAVRATSGGKLFEFYRDVIRLRRRHDALRSPHIEVLHAHDANRVLVFRRWLAHQEFLVFASFSNTPFADGYRISHSALHHGVFIEVLNSDSAAYGGGGVTNTGRLISAHGDLNPRLPANGVVVFQRVSLITLGSRPGNSHNPGAPASNRFAKSPEAAKTVSRTGSAALAVCDVDQHLLTVDRTDRQADDFANPQSRCISGCSGAE